VRPWRHSEQNAHNTAGSAWVCARQVQRAIAADANGSPQFARVGQNITTAAMLLCNLPEPTDPQQQELHRNIRMLVEHAAVQQAESSASRHRHATSCPSGGGGGRPGRLNKKTGPPEAGV
jgi:hypothetical protein